MNTVIIILLLIATILFILSFFQRDRVTLLEKELEDLSITILQEQYQMNKRLKVLEEELLVDKDLLNHMQNKSSTNTQKGIPEILVNQVLALHAQGLSIDQIATQSARSISEVKSIIATRNPKGGA